MTSSLHILPNSFINLPFSLAHSELWTASLNKSHINKITATWDDPCYKQQYTDYDLCLSFSFHYFHFVSCIFQYCGSLNEVLIYSQSSWGKTSLQPLCNSNIFSASHLDTYCSMVSVVRTIEKTQEKSFHCSFVQNKLHINKNKTEYVQSQALSK